jgi:hypothetical protein
VPTRGTRARNAGTARVRRPRIAHPSTPNRASTLIAAAASVACVAAAVRASAPAAGGAGAPRGIADGVQRLRAAVVGDVPRPGGRTGAGAATARASDAHGARGPIVPATARTPAAERVTVRVPRGAAAAVTPGVPWWADSAHWGADVVRWTETTREAVVVDAGDTVTVAPPPLPAALPAALRRRGVRWHADGAAALAAPGGAGGGAAPGRRLTTRPRAPPAWWAARPGRPRSWR